MTTKLVIYDYDICGKPAYYSENANADGSIKSWGYCGISEEKAKITAIKEVYEGVAAAVKLWDMTFDNLSDKDKQIILSVFPTLLERDKTKLKPPSEIISIARAKIQLKGAVYADDRFHFQPALPLCVSRFAHGSIVVPPRRHQCDDHPAAPMAPTCAPTHWRRRSTPRG